MATTVSLRDEVVELLRQLIRVDTVNPPGNETGAATLLRDYLEANGVQCELYARVPERANLVARIPGRGDGPRLLLLSHTDTVLADASEWKVDPWSGELRDDAVWGRGALDMKGQVAASAVAIASLAREGFRPAGDLIFAATADEEVGDGYGLQWLCEAHPQAVETEYSLNEGAGDRIELGGRALYVCGVAEKMTAPFLIRVHGRSGHASMPGIADNALVKAAPLIERLGAIQMEARLEPEVSALIETVSGQAPADADSARATVQAIDPLVAELAEPLFAPTLSPTLIQASHKRNVIPAVCEITVDCRLLPGQTASDAETIIRAALGGDIDYELEWLAPHGGTRSPLDTPLWDVVAGFVAGIEPGAIAVPLIVPGFTDSHWLREAFGTVAYGFFPMRTMSAELAARLIHSADERVLVDDLELGLTFLRHAALSFADMSA